MRKFEFHNLSLSGLYVFIIILASYCKCMLLLDFDSNTDDQSCNTVFVENVEPKVSLTGRNIPPSGKAGKFR